MSRNRSSHDFTIAVLLGLVAIGLGTSPPAWHERVRATIGDLARPGQQAVVQLRSRLREWRKDDELPDDAPALAELQQTNNELSSRCRQLEAANLALRQKLIDDRSETIVAARQSEPLIVDDVVTAQLLGEDLATGWRQKKFLDRGARDRVEELSLVLEDENPLIDLGEEGGVSDRAAVLIGRKIIGTVHRVGRWSSTMLPVEHPEFRASARLGRRTERGLFFAAEGVLAGAGEGKANLKFIEATEPVAEGDDVFASSSETLSGAPLYFGKIVEARLDPGAPYWEIVVDIGPGDISGQTVQVLRKTVNPARMLAN